MFVADAHRDDGKRFVLRADEKLTAFPELESAIRACRNLFRRPDLVVQHSTAVVSPLSTVLINFDGGFIRANFARYPDKDYYVPRVRT